MSILIPDIAIMEKILRSVVVYLFLLVSFLLAGKRLLGQLAAFDLVVLLIISNVVENVPTVLIRHGEVLQANLDREHMSMAELRAALHKEGVTRVSEVRWALLEENGLVSVVHRGAQPA